MSYIAKLEAIKVELARLKSQPHVQGDDSRAPVSEVLIGSLESLTRTIAMNHHWLDVPASKYLPESMMPPDRKDTNGQEQWMAGTVSLCISALQDLFRQNMLFEALLDSIPLSATNLPPLDRSHDHHKSSSASHSSTGEQRHSGHDPTHVHKSHRSEKDQDGREHRRHDSSTRSSSAPGREHGSKHDHKTDHHTGDAKVKPAATDHRSPEHAHSSHEHKSGESGASSSLPKRPAPPVAEKKGTDLPQFVKVPEV